MPTVVWGGAGADHIEFSMSNFGGWGSVHDFGGNGNSGPGSFASDFSWTTGQFESLGIAVVNVENLNEDNFHTFDLNDLGVQFGADWAEFDVVLLNPDASDRIFFEMPDLSMIQVGTTTSSFYGYTTTIEEAPLGPDDLPSLFYAERVVSMYDLQLGGSTIQVQSAGSDLADVYMNDGGDLVNQTNYLASLDGWDDELINGGAAGSNGEGHENIAITPSGVGTFTSTEAIGGANSNWFIYGGSVNGTTFSANGTVSVTLEDVEPFVLPLLDTSIGQPDEINGSSGNDTVDLGSSTTPTIVTLGAGDDVVTDGQGDDTLDGGVGRDRFFAGGGADSYDGGSDRDEVFYSTATVGLTIDSTDGSNGTGIAAGDSFANIEYIHGSDHNDVIIADVERIYGHSGNDVLQDGAGAQRLIGGAGADTFRLISGDGAQDRVADFAIGEDMFDLSLWGASHLSDLTIYEATNGQGNPQGRLVIEYGGESLREDGLDTADIASLTAAHFIFDDDAGGGSSGSGSAVVDGTAGLDIIDASFVDADGDSISDEGQTILAGDGNDRIYDGGGDDTVEGGLGRDLFYAGAGADSYDGGADRDEVYYTTATAGLTIDTTNGSSGTGIAAGDTFANIEYVHGSEFDDIITADVERIFGRDGNDVLQDGAGAQRLFGGAGADTFRFATGDGTEDRVADFTIGEDMFDLSLWGATQRSDLSIYEATNGQGNPQGRLVIEYGGERVRVDGLDTSDIASLTADYFVFA